MNFKKNKWTKKDGQDYIDYLVSLKNEEKQSWYKNILNTKMKVLALKTLVMKKIAKDIMAGNYLSFLDLELNNYYENSAINGHIICKIDNFKLMNNYLDKYVLKIDNWALCDLLSFDIKNHHKEFYDLALKYLNSNLPFVKRVGFIILFKFINEDDYIDNIFNIMNKFYYEEHYYVNMVNAWLFCECFIKRRDKTIEFLKTHQLNKFTINKGISKCRDSFRVSKEDKELLLQYKIK